MQRKGKIQPIIRGKENHSRLKWMQKWHNDRINEQDSTLLKKAKERLNMLKRDVERYKKKTETKFLEI